MGNGIDTKPFVELGKLHNAVQDRDHYDGCELKHASCAVLYLAGALDAAQKRLDQRSVLIEQLIGENEDYSDKLEGARAEIERLRAENAEARAFNAPLIRDWEGEAEDEAWRGLGNA